LAGTNAGVFWFSGLSAGRFVIRCMTSSSGGAVAVNLSDPDIDDLRIILNPLVRISGVVRLEGGGAGDAGEPDLYKLRVSLGSTDAGVPLQPDGTFVTNGVIPGDYSLMVNGLPQNMYLKGVRFGEMDIRNGSLRIDPQTQSTLELLLSAKGGRLDVLAVDENGRPSADAVAVLVPDVSWRSHTELFRSTVTDAAGHAHFDGIAPGDYTLMAWQDIDDAWHDPAIIGMFENRGERIRISEGKLQETRVIVN
jgi:hypothetical protein